MSEAAASSDLSSGTSLVVVDTDVVSFLFKLVTHNASYYQGVPELSVITEAK